jgi:His-Xaa-Ser system radical SAM maturase HxsC
MGEPNGGEGHLMRKVEAAFQPGYESRVHRVVEYADVAYEWVPELRFLVRVQSEEERRGVERLRAAGLPNLIWVESACLEAADVVVTMADKDEVIVLFRETDRHHALFLTNRCNSYCLMCSQPPTTADDSWLVEEAIDAIRHIRRSPQVLGLTGGEPLLLGAGLRRVLDSIARYHPHTKVEVLTNGRLFSDQHLSRQLLERLTVQVRWLVPLYAHADFVHDFVVQSPGAFDETIAGLLELQAWRQEIQLRVVLIEPVLKVLPELAGFIGRNFPFVREVALMGCEPIGFAMANRDTCEVDLAQWGRTLEQASRILRRHSVTYLLMNAPLCALPQALWASASKSISDWKNVFPSECDGCEMKSDCSGLFAWHETGWKPAPLKKMQGNEVHT